MNLIKTGLCFQDNRPSDIFKPFRFQNGPSGQRHLNEKSTHERSYISNCTYVTSERQQASYIVCAVFFLPSSSVLMSQRERQAHILMSEG